MSFEIKINADQRIEYVSHFAPGRGSLSALGASGLVDYLNDIPDHESLYAVGMGVAAAPFGVVIFPERDDAQELARRLLHIARTDRADEVAAWRAAGSLGEWRKALCARYMGGMNAPGDLWIRCVAYACRAEGPRPEPVDPNQLALDLEPAGGAS
ncbi:MAG TPA: hypothetical protein VIY27_09245 [Myxococcota bacterium]